MSHHNSDELPCKHSLIDLLRRLQKNFKRWERARLAAAAASSKVCRSAFRHPTCFWSSSISRCKSNFWIVPAWCIFVAAAIRSSSSLNSSAAFCLSYFHPEYGTCEPQCKGGNYLCRLTLLPLCRDPGFGSYEAHSKGNIYLFGIEVSSVSEEFAPKYNLSHRRKLAFPPWLTKRPWSSCSGRDFKLATTLAWLIISNIFPVVLSLPRSLETRWSLRAAQIFLSAFL